MKDLIQINKPNFESATFQAHRIFLSLTDHTYPISTIRIIKNLYKTELMTYQEFSVSINKNINFICDHLAHNNDAFTLNKGDKAIIIYNDDTNLNTIERIRFSLAHEIGHIVLLHFSDNDSILTRGGLTSEKYKILEKEADTFARELLAPPALIRPSWSIKEVKDMFDISRQAAEISLNIRHRYPWIKPTIPLQAVIHGNGIKFNKHKKEQFVLRKKLQLISTKVTHKKKTRQSMYCLSISCNYKRYRNIL